MQCYQALVCARIPAEVIRMPPLAAPQRPGRHVSGRQAEILMLAMASEQLIGVVTQVATRAPGDVRARLRIVVEVDPYRAAARTPLLKPPLDHMPQSQDERHQSDRLDDQYDLRVLIVHSQERFEHFINVHFMNPFLLTKFCSFG